MIQKLIKKIQEKDAPVIVGLDPMFSYVPDYIKKDSIEKQGETLEAAADAIWQFNQKIIDATCDLIPAVKPQIAMYEQYGVPGIQVFQKTVEYCHEKGLLVLADVKRGDIGSTSAAYAAGHLGSVMIGSTVCHAFDSDFATVNPYLGTDGVEPFLKVCREEDKGIFILVKTSNPSSGEFQDQQLGDKPLYELVAQKVVEWGETCRQGEYSDVGCVIGATYPEMAKALRKKMPHTYILVPGYGAQGGKAKDLVSYFNPDGLGAIVNSSRGIICAYKNEKYLSYGEDHFALASRQAVLDMIADINGARKGR